MSNYDLLEATYLLARGHAIHVPSAHVEGRKAAGQALLKGVAEASKAAGYGVEEGPSGVIVKQPGCSAYAAFDGDRIMVGREGKKPAQEQEARLYFNPLTKRFEGWEDDAFYHAAPGEPRSRRSAVAVVAEMLLAVLDPMSRK